MLVRRRVHSMGYRYRLHRQDLPGTPDLVFPGRRKIIFVNGCFWHAHGCWSARVPKSNVTYWLPKLERNRARDQQNLAALHALGWRPLVVWECEIGDELAHAKRLRAFLG